MSAIPPLTDDQIKELFFRVMRDMILEIRTDAYLAGQKKTHMQADLIHNLPYVLRYDPSKTEHEKLQNCYEWFAIEMTEGAPFKAYLEKMIKQVLETVPA